MKNIHILPVFLLLLTAGCSDSFLDVQPTDRFTQDNFWNTREHAEAALNATYASLTNGGLLGGITPLLLETVTPNAYNYSNVSGFGNLAQGIHDAANTAVINNAWGASYAGIGRANNFLANIDQVRMDDALKSRFIAEAKFLRALYYVELWSRYGGAPLILEATNFTTQSELPRNSPEELLNQIVKDLDEAAPDLPLAYGGNDRGRATQAAALTLKARTLLYAGQWNEAAAAAKAVIDLKTHRLFPDYRGLFYLENENNPEVIFDIQYKFPEFAHGMDIHLDQFNNIAPLPDLVNDYYMTDGKPYLASSLYNPQKPYENRDPRLMATIIVVGSQYKGAQVTEKQYPQTGFGQKKYTIYKDNEKPVAPKVEGQSELNYMVLRYADVLLMYAEAQNEAAGPDPSVYEAVNQLRRRVKMPDLPEGLSQAQLRDEIRHERRIELAGEGRYYFDIRRWKTAEQVMNTDIYNAKGARIGTRRFDPARDYLWPVPSIAILNNPALAQNSGYGK